MSGGGVPVVLTPTDLTNQAVKLGATRRINDNGIIYAQDDFGNGINAWRAFDAGWVANTGSVSWSAAKQARSGFSSRIDVTLANAGGIMERFTPPYFLEKPNQGFEVAFLYDTTGGNDDNILLLLMLGYLAGGIDYHTQVNVLPTSLQVIGAGSVTNILAGMRYLNKDLWHRIKVTVDFTGKKCRSLYIDDQSWDISSIGLVVQTDTSAVRYIIDSIIQGLPNGGGAFTGQLHIGEVIHTIGEP